MEKPKVDLTAILEKCIPIFKKIENLKLKLVRAETIDDVDAIMRRATSYWGYLQIIYSKVETYKKNKELKYFHDKKQELEKNKIKIQISAIENEASNHVASERKIRNHIEAYMNVADRIISVCQTSSKNFLKDFQRG